MLNNSKLEPFVSKTNSLSIRSQGKRNFWYENFWKHYYYFSFDHPSLPYIRLKDTDTLGWNKIFFNHYCAFDLTTFIYCNTSRKLIKMHRIAKHKRPLWCAEGLSIFSLVPKSSFSQLYSICATQISYIRAPRSSQITRAYTIILLVPFNPLISILASFFGHSTLKSHRSAAPWALKSTDWL